MCKIIFFILCLAVIITGLVVYFLAKDPEDTNNYPNNDILMVVMASLSFILLVSLTCSCMSDDTDESDSNTLSDDDDVPSEYSVELEIPTIV